MWASYLFIALVFVCIAAIVGAIIDYFGDRKTYPWYVQATCFVAFFFPFTIIVLLPLDLASTRYYDCLQQQPSSTLCEPPPILVSHDFLYNYWMVAYWITFNIQIFVIPIMQGYVRSGETSFFGRLRDGVMDNIIFYAMCGGVGIIFVLYAIFGLKISASQLITLSIPAANAYGLMLLTVMMGYGLIEVPRGLWYNADVKWVLRYLEYQAPKLKEACVDSEAEIYEVARLVGHASRKVPASDPLRTIVDKLMEKCPLALQQRNTTNPSSRTDDDDDDLPQTFTRAKLVELHARIRRAVFLNQRDQAQMRYLLHRAFLCQDIIANTQSNLSTPIMQRQFKSIMVNIQDSDKYKTQKLQLLYWWHVYLKPILMRLLCFTCIVSSILVVWSESTFQITSTTLSIPALFLDTTTFTYTSLEFLSIMFISYMCVSTYTTLLTINLFDFYQMVPEHHTDEVSLLFVGAYLCKLTFPLCYNFLNMGGLAEGKRVPISPNTTTSGSDTDSTRLDYSSSPVFIQYLGPAVNLTPLFGTGYNDWVAFFVLIMCILILLNVHARALSVFRLDVFWYRSFTPKRGQSRGNGPATDISETEEGRAIIDQARGMEERRIQRGLGVSDGNRDGNSGNGGVGLGYGSSGSAASASSSTSRPRNARELLDRYSSRRQQGQQQGISNVPISSQQGRNQSRDVESGVSGATTRSGNMFNMSAWFSRGAPAPNSGGPEPATGTATGSRRVWGSNQYQRMNAADADAQDSQFTEYDDDEDNRPLVPPSSKQNAVTNRSTKPGATNITSMFGSNFKSSSSSQPAQPSPSKTSRKFGVGSGTSTPPQQSSSGSQQQNNSSSSTAAKPKRNFFDGI